MSKGLVRILSFKSKITLQLAKLNNNYFLIAFGLLLFILTLRSIFVIIILLIYLGYLYIKRSDIFYFIIFIITSFFISFLINSKILKLDEENHISGTVINIYKDEKYQKIIVSNNFRKVILYDESFKDIQIGNYISASGTKSNITDNRIPNSFNYKQYYYSIRVNNIIYTDEITVSKNINIYFFKNIIYKYIDYFHKDNSNIYIKAFVLGDNYLIYEEDKLNFSINGITHLFAISGLHITFLISMILNLLKKTNITKTNIDKITVITLLIYIVLTSFSVSVVRAILLYIMTLFSKKYKLNLTQVDILSIIFIFLLIINPSYMHNLSFKFSFLASFFIILISKPLNEFIEKYKLSKFYEILLISVLIQIILFPLMINITNTYNILSILTNILFIFIVSTIILPLSYLIFIFPLFSIPFNYLLEGFIKLNTICSIHFNISKTFPTFSFFEIIVYYTLLIFIFTFFKTSKRYQIILIKVIFLIIYYNKINLNPNGSVVFLDVYQGDCIVIDLPYNQGVVVIDTGTGRNNSLTNYLNSIGARKIDIVFITHNDLDHNGELEHLVKNIKVTKVVISAYDSNVLLKKLPNVTKVREGDVIKLKKTYFNIYSPKEDYKDDNKNSLVIHTKLGNYNYLFLGDAPIEIEEELIKYNLEVDVIKIGHHGSKTSTSEKFLKSINPTYAIIQVGQIKLYGFPHQEVISKLSSYEVYRTDLNYSITIKYSKKKSIINGLR